jgi:hypothetical protein
MTYPEDRVLVAVINRKRDLAYARDDHWYRIPEAKLARGLNAEYIGFFLSRAFGEKNGAVHYYAPVKGIELVYRRWLLPEEYHHPRAEERYYKVGLADLIEKTPPILNNTKRSIAFIYTTWDRFIHARTIADLYSKADYFVDRIYHALRMNGLPAARTWEAEHKIYQYSPYIEIKCKDGTVKVCANPVDEALYFDWATSQDAIMARIREEIYKNGGPLDINVPLEGF